MPKRLAKGATIPTEFPSVPHVRPNSSNSSQLPIPILTNAYSLSDSLQFPPPTTLHSSHFRCCCCCCLLYPLLPAAPPFLSSFSRFFYYFFHCHEAASSGWRHSHTNMATLEGTQRGGSSATSQPAYPPSLEKGRRHRKCQVNNPKHTPYGTSSRGTPMLQIPTPTLC